jgi:hypothetical protein
MPEYNLHMTPKLGLRALDMISAMISRWNKTFVMEK